MHLFQPATGELGSTNNDVNGLIERDVSRYKELLVIILQKVMNQNAIDHHFIVGYMSDLDKSTAVGILKKITVRVGHQYKKALVGYFLS